MGRAFTEQLLDEEVERATKDLGLPPERVHIWRDGTDVLVSFTGRDDAAGLFRLGCARFDAEAPTLAMLDPVSRVELENDRWSPGVSSGVHPATQRPFVCQQGLAEYHSHPSHLTDAWDKYRYRFRLPQTIRRLLEKAGAT